MGHAPAFAAPGVTVTAGSYELQAQDTLVVWPNSPTSTLAIDNGNNRGFANWRVRWNNCLAGSFVATPEGVVVGSSPDGRAIEGTATLQPAERQVWIMRPNLGARYQFAVMGNLPIGAKQGPSLKQLGVAMSQAKSQFVVHLGDVRKAPSLADFQMRRGLLPSLALPAYCVSDQRSPKETNAWKQVFGETQHSFRLGPDAFVMLDNASGSITPHQEAGLLKTLESLRKEPVRHIFVFGHLPLVDVRPGLNQGMQNRAQVRRLLRAFSQHRVHTVFGGRLGLFAAETRHGVRYITTGGAGDRLVTSPANGGFHHWIKVSVSDDGRVGVTPEKVTFPSSGKK